MTTRWIALMFLAAGSAFAEPGADVWAARCKGCHGPDGKAQTRIGAQQKIPDLSSPRWQQAFADDDIRRVVRDGSDMNPKMKAFGNVLSAADIDAVVRYIRTLRAR